MNHDVREVLRAPGKLSINPQSVLSGAYPWGGTAIGVWTGIYADFRRVTYIVRAEEHGGQPVEAIEAGEGLEVLGRLSSVDPSALALLFPTVASGTTTQRPLVTGNVSNAGKLASTRAAALLFTPENLDRVPFVYLPVALPLLEDTAQLMLGADRRWGIPAKFLSVPSSAGQTYQMGPRKDLVLP